MQNPIHFEFSSPSIVRGVRVGLKVETRVRNRMRVAWIVIRFSNWNWNWNCRRLPLGIAHCSMPQGVIVCGTHNALTHTHIQTHTHTISDHLLRTERAPLPSAAPPPLFNLLPAKCVQSDRSFGQIKRRFAGSPAHSSSLHSLHSQLVPYRHYIYVWHIVEASLYIYLYRITPNTASAWNCSRDLIESILKCW